MRYYRTNRTSAIHHPNSPISFTNLHDPKFLRNLSPCFTPAPAPAKTSPTGSELPRSSVIDKRLGNRRKRGDAIASMACSIHPWVRHPPDRTYCIRLFEESVRFFASSSILSNIKTFARSWRESPSGIRPLRSRGLDSSGKHKAFNHPAQRYRAGKVCSFPMAGVIAVCLVPECLFHDRWRAPRERR